MSILHARKKPFLLLTHAILKHAIATLVVSSLAAFLPAQAQTAAPPQAGAVNPNTVIRYDTGQAIITPAHARHGMVVSEQRLATQVGLDILRRGGNAVDAAAAVGFALAVVLPNAGNIGGGGFMLIHDAKSGKDTALDFREVAPLAAKRDMFLDAQGNPVPGGSTYTHLAVGVPGTVAGLSLALKKYGTMPLADVIAPAIRLARNGFIVSDTLGEALAGERDHMGQWPASRAIFFKDGRPLQSGEKLVQTDLAHSMQLIARDGPAAFYEGSIARKIVAEMARHGGAISAADLKNYRVVERQPIMGDYRGYRVVAMPPPSSGGVHIIEMLNILERYPLRDYGADSAQTIHLMAEAMKLAYADRAEHLGDPDFIKVPLQGLISHAYADKQAARIDTERATPSSAIKAGRPQAYESDQTTQFSVADKYGNVVSATYTLNLNFGSGIVADGTGITLNNEMDDFSVKAGVANAFGLTGGDANAVGAGKRPLSSMSPTIVLKDGKPFLVTGSPGGSRIITTVLQTILNVIDHQMNIAEAAMAPRIHHQWMPDRLRIEKGLSRDTLRLLEQKGYVLALEAPMGRTQTIQLTPDGFDGFSDTRDPDGAALGY
ncbi:gamma-glutamyltransferase [Oxalobacteraceae bacterium CAVE-383]|nr:gamma-glutamyltransferase [Oxalobacteraceae bacterium CAVE-383]